MEMFKVQQQLRWSFSDATLKENIVAPPRQWSDIKHCRSVKYNFKDQPKQLTLKSA
jgi:hypothetical protein